MGAAEPLHPSTVTGYLDDLIRIFVLEPQVAWATHLRSKVRRRTAPRWHFVDPSLAAAMLTAGTTRLLDDLGAFGMLFESLAIRDLRIYASRYGGQVYHYRDESGLEIDAIVETRDGRWLGVEVKLGGTRAVDLGARNLLALADKVAPEVRKRLAGLVVLTAGRVSLTRSDGVHVVALGHLKD